MGKAVDDIEMGRKTVWSEMGSSIDQCEGQLHNRTAVKDGELDDLSPEIRTTVDETSERVGVHPRRSSWGRKSGSWEMSPEVLALAARVGEPNRVGGSSSSLSTENRHS
jgi:palmitoyltransferase ZDHHC9/14/18